VFFHDFGRFGPFWGHFGAIFGRFGPFLTYFGPNFGRKRAPAACFFFFFFFIVKIKKNQRMWRKSTQKAVFRVIFCTFSVQNRAKTSENVLKTSKNGRKWRKTDLETSIIGTASISKSTKESERCPKSGVFGAFLSVFGGFCGVF
jgi:hypothetical protein